MSESETSVKQQPLAKVQQGKIKLACFPSKFGKYSIVVQKGYKLKNSDEWVNSSITLFDQDVSNLKLALTEMETILQNKK